MSLRIAVVSTNEMLAYISAEFKFEITFENTNFIIISSQTKTEILCLSLSMSLRIFVNPGPGVFTFIQKNIWCFIDHFI